VWVSSQTVTSPSIVLRTVTTTISALVATFAASTAILLIAAVRPSSTLIQRVIVAWSRAWLTPAGVDLQVIGQEHVDPATSYVVVANHRSNIDVMVSFAALPIPIRFLAKAELFRIPVFAQAMRAIGIVEVDRKHTHHMSIIDTVNEQAEKVIARGHSLIIYPEGTRSRDGAPRPFKKGAFTMAVASGMPVLPVAIHGTRRVWAPNRIWVHPGTVTVVIDPPIDTTGIGRAEVDRLRARVQDQINGHLDRLRAEMPTIDER
jgi:1-acyl-sn-glycerol-3-phosphate acyltransferase